MSKHTKGPWHVVLSDNATPHIMHENGHDFTDISEISSCVCVMPAEITYSYNSLANARLIAAAPELLEALEGFVDFPADTFDGDHDQAFTMTVRLNDMRKARAVIAKAKGEQ